MLAKPPFHVPADILEVAHACHLAGGRALLVGGWVRDTLLGKNSKDWDYEVYGLPLDRLEQVLSTFGEVIKVGRAFGVLKVKNLDLDISIPRRDSKVGQGHRGFIVDLDPTLNYKSAALRRDLTINSIAYDPLTHEVLDPYDGRSDLIAKVLRAVNAKTFIEDPLRALRVAQFAARLEFSVTPELEAVCAKIPLSELPGERIQGELNKLLLKAVKPSIGFEFLVSTGLIQHFPELVAMRGVPQDAEWHPEGDVWVHTMMVLDEAALLRIEDTHKDGILMYGALCHDLGKVTTTFEDNEGRVRSPGHEEAGVEPTEQLLGRLKLGHDLIEGVVAIVRHHLAPAMLFYNKATAKAYRRLARKLGAAGIDAELLYRSAKADHFGRTTPDALARSFPEGEHFMAEMEALNISDQAPVDVVQGRHLIARGFSPGPHFGEILARCREVQDDEGWTDPEQILNAVLKDENC